jgi:cleavage and polyadenylation specificity factor subunit 2
MYAVGLNHMRERSLDGTVLIKPGGAIKIFEPLARPDLFITDGSRTQTISPRKKDRETAFLHVISSTLANRRSVLIPANLDSRLLELLVLLDQHWSFAKLKFPLCFVGRNGENMLVAVRSLMEWFGGVIGSGIAASGVGADGGPKRKAVDDSPLKFHHIQFFASPAHLLQTYSSRDPKLIIAVPYSMSFGPSRSIFAEHGIGVGEGNLVLLIRKGENGTWAHALWDKWNIGQRTAEDVEMSKNVGHTVRLVEDVTLKVSCIFCTGRMCSNLKLN